MSNPAPVSKEQLIQVRNTLIDLREQAMGHWDVPYQTLVTIGVSQATLAISDTLTEMGVDLKELNAAREKT